MEIFPAIDLKDAKVVRLTQGDFNRVRVYAEDPVDVASGFIGMGAANLHVIDLDGARDGALVNIGKIKELTGLGQMFVQVGGGIRDQESIEAYLGAGVDRVILGTAAVENFAFLERMVQKYGKHISVSVDARDGKVATHGWLNSSNIDAYLFCIELQNAGVQTIIFTDISRDGLLKGVNADLYANLNTALSCNIIAAGGVSGYGDISALRQIGLHGAIIGKALYEGNIDLAKVLEGA